MSWQPLYSTRFIETVRRNAEAIAVRDHEAVIAYYNAQPDALLTQLVPFRKICNTRFTDLFFPERFKDYPVLIIASETGNADEKDGYFDSAYSLICEVWTLGSDPFVLRSWTERYASVVAQMLLAGTAADYMQGVSVEQHSKVTVNIGTIRPRNPIRAASSNLYQDMVTVPLTVSYKEI